MDAVKELAKALSDTCLAFISKYYPRDHLRLAGVLCFLLFVVLLVPGEDQAKTEAVGKRIDIPVALSARASGEIVRENTPGPGGATAPATAAADSDAPAPAADAGVRAAAPANLEDYVVSNSEQLADVALWKSVRVEQGDTLSTIFSQVGLSDRDVFQVLNSSDEARVLNRLYPGYQLDFKIPEPGELEQLRLLSSPLEGYEFIRKDSGYRVEKILKEAELQQAFKVGTIADSLFMAGQRENIPAVHIMEMANIFGGVIDFILDPRAGDQFSILYEEKYLNGEFIGPGEILATRFVNQGKVYTAIRYVDEEGEVGYYSPEGESMRKAFLRNPLDVFRISSNFNPRRRHPILNTIRAHKGTDYAAPRGSPIRATGDGRITYAGRYGSFGNLVTIQHAGGFETKYAHLSRFGSGISRGGRVRQGQIIGYVGSTGSATGPHLHYEFLVSGVHKNPRTILDQLPKAVSIEPDQMPRFQAQTAGLLQQFEELNSSRLLTLNQPSAD